MSFETQRLTIRELKVIWATDKGLFPFNNPNPVHQMRKIGFLLLGAIALLCFVFYSFFEEIGRFRAENADLQQGLAEIRSRKDELEKRFAESEKKYLMLSGINQQGGFFGWPNPKPGQKYHFLVMAKVRGQTSNPLDMGATYLIVYDLERKMTAAIFDTDGVDYEVNMIVTVEAEGNKRVRNLIRWPETIPLAEKFGIHLK